MTKLIDKFEQGSDEDWNTCLKKPDVDHFLYEPREGASGTFKCTDCSAVYKSASSFKKHNKLKHKKTVVAKGPTTKCRLKHQRGTRAKEDHAYDQITSHLHLVHGMQKPAKGLNFTGWVTTDDKKTWHPHYAKKHDPAPTPETYVRVQYTSTKKANKACSCYNTTTTTTTDNLFLLVPPTTNTANVPSRKQHRRTRSNSRGDRFDRSRSKSPRVNNNRLLVIAALVHNVLPEGVENARRGEVMKKIFEHDSLHFLILFNGDSKKNIRDSTDMIQRKMKSFGSIIVITLKSNG